jgi:hypothetical protein
MMMAIFAVVVLLVGGSALSYRTIASFMAFELLEEKGLTPNFWFISMPFYLWRNFVARVGDDLRLARILNRIRVADFVVILSGVVVVAIVFLTQNWNN